MKNKVVTFVRGVEKLYYGCTRSAATVKREGEKLLADPESSVAGVASVCVASYA